MNWRLIRGRLRMTITKKLFDLNVPIQVKKIEREKTIARPIKWRLAFIPFSAPFHPLLCRPSMINILKQLITFTREPERRRKINKKNFTKGATRDRGPRHFLTCFVSLVAVNSRGYKIVSRGFCVLIFCRSNIEIVSDFFARFFVNDRAAVESQAEVLVREK